MSLVFFAAADSLPRSKQPSQRASRSIQSAYLFPEGLRPHSPRFHITLMRALDNIEGHVSQAA